MSTRNETFFGVALLSLAILVLELALTRLFSATMYYHFAFMAISIALFGSGASGVAVYLAQARLDARRTGRWLTWSALGFSLGTLVALGVVIANPLELEAAGGNNIRLVKIYAATAVPFFLGGSAVSLAITRFAPVIARLYAFDLAGAAAGCALLIPLVDLGGAVNTILVAAALGAVAATLFGRTPGAGRADARWAALAAAGLALVAVWNLATGTIGIHKAKGLSEENVLFSKWNSFSRITVRGRLDRPFLRIQIDADAATRIVRNATDPRLQEGLRRSVKGLAYHLRPRARALILGPGGGSDVMIARAFGAGPITGVEVNPIIARDVMSSEPFRSYSGGIFQQPGVDLVVDEGRSFVRASRERYDVIQATLVDTWAATAAGAFALTENNLYTVEAFRDYAAHLEPDGILTMTRWYFEPPDQLLRLLALTRAMMAETGIRDPAAHVMLVRDPAGSEEYTPATYLFSPRPFSGDEVRSVEAMARENGFEILFTPRTRPANLFTRIMEAPDPAEVWRHLPTDVSPTRDNNPFFFNSVRIRDLSRALGGSEEWQKTNLGMLVLVGVLGLTAVLVLACILGPLVVARRAALRSATGAKLAYLCTFACLGAGFIVVEVVLVQKFILFLGHPVYALTVVIFALLVSSACGSRLSARVAPEGAAAALRRRIAPLAGLIVLYVVALPPAFAAMAPLGRPLRIAVTVALVAPLGLLMGMPMPIALRALAGRLPEVVPWAWGVNGATSVLGSAAALVIAILSGFNQALLAGAALYGASALLFAVAERRAPAPALVREGRPAEGGARRAEARRGGARPRRA